MLIKHRWNERRCMHRFDIGIDRWHNILKNNPRASSISYSNDVDWAWCTIALFSLSILILVSLNNIRFGIKQKDPSKSSDVGRRRFFFDCIHVSHIESVRIFSGKIISNYHWPACDREISSFSKEIRHIHLANRLLFTQTQKIISRVKWKSIHW